jgi:probable F420-dependent oxidoreductase
MKLTGSLGQGPVAEVADTVRLAEECGLSRVWSSDLAHDPFLPLALAADRSRTIELGTGVAIALGRSPWAMAQVAWDLAQMSGQRFALGLGTQVRAHVERRIGGSWHPPAAYMRSYVGALRAIWAHWADREPLRYRSEHFDLSLSAPLFQGEPGGTPPPVFLAGVNMLMCRLAGEVADGFIAHGFGSPVYLRESVLPELFRDRDRASLTVVVPALIAASDDPEELAGERERVRSQVAFYASTPAYRPVLTAHGLDALGEKLTALSKEQRWADMAAAVDDDVLDLYALCGTPHEVGRLMRQRFSGLADEIYPLQPLGQSDRSWWAGIQAGLAAAADERHPR